MDEVKTLGELDVFDFDENKIKRYLNMMIFILKNGKNILNNFKLFILSKNLLKGILKLH